MSGLYAYLNREIVYAIKRIADIWHRLTCFPVSPTNKQWRVDDTTKKAVCMGCGYVYPFVTFDLPEEQ